MTPCSSCSERMKPPSSWPMTRSSGQASGATTCTSSPRARSAAATSRPMKLAPTTTARVAPVAPAMMARLSANERREWTSGPSPPGTVSLTGSAPVASSSAP